jgi:hypothetical protein
LEAAATKKAGNARFSASGPAGHPVRNAASSSVVSAASGTVEGYHPLSPGHILGMLMPVCLRPYLGVHGDSGMTDWRHFCEENRLQSLFPFHQRKFR